jgi:hypothetical protein
VADESGGPVKQLLIRFRAGDSGALGSWSLARAWLYREIAQTSTPSP